MSIYLPEALRKGLIPLIDAMVDEYRPVVADILGASQVDRQHALDSLVASLHRFMISTRKARYGPEQQHEKWIPSLRRDALSSAEWDLHAELRRRTDDGQQVGGQCAYSIYRFLTELLGLDKGPQRYKRHQLAEELLSGFGADKGFYAGISSQVRHEMNARFLQPYREEKRQEFGDL